MRAYGCTKLKVFPSALRLASLRSLILNWCSSLQNFPAILGKMDNLKSVSIDSTGIRELPPSIGNLVGLQELSMTSCLSLKELPDNCSCGYQLILFITNNCHTTLLWNNLHRTNPCTIRNGINHLDFQ